MNDAEKWYTVHRIFINQHKLGNGATQSYRTWGWQLVVTTSFRSGAGRFSSMLVIIKNGGNNEDDLLVYTTIFRRRRPSMDRVAYEIELH